LRRDVVADAERCVDDRRVSIVRIRSPYVELSLRDADARDARIRRRRGDGDLLRRIAVVIGEGRDALQRKRKG
jgi:hypothetical protein